MNDPVILSGFVGEISWWFVHKKHLKSSLFSKRQAHIRKKKNWLSVTKINIFKAQNLKAFKGSKKIISTLLALFFQHLSSQVSRLCSKKNSHVSQLLIRDQIYNFEVSAKNNVIL